MGKVRPAGQILHAEALLPVRKVDFQHNIKIWFVYKFSPTSQKFYEYGPQTKKIARPCF